MARARTRRLRRVGGLTAVVTTALLSAVTLPAHAVPQGTVIGAGEPGTVGGSYVVTLKEGVKASSAAGRGVAARYGVRISQTYGSVLNGFAVEADARRAGLLAADSRVASVVQDRRVRLDAAGPGPVQDSRVRWDAAGPGPASWGLDRLDQRSLPLDGGYGRPGPAGAGVTVYVIDTGIRIGHRDFGGRAAYGWDFVDGDARAEDGNGHGTHVAGTVAGARYGVAGKAKVVAVRVLDDAGAGTTARVIAGIDWVTRHAHRPAVANLSLGGAHNPQLDAAVRESIRAGITYTVAAGNAARPAGSASPADVREAITVGATDRTDTRAPFSNYGPALDLFAPGVSITSASYASDTARATFSGTSMAAPHAAGAAALYLAGHQRATPAQVSEALVSGAVKGGVSGAGPGSPNRLLQVPRS